MKKQKKIILASSSPRRIEILKKLDLDFEVIPSDYEEVLESLIFSYEKIEDLAYNKALAVFDKITKHSLNSLNDTLIISADTVVVLNKQILTKPKNEKEAIRMLKSLSGQKHSVVTSVCVIDLNDGAKRMLSETSYVVFEHLSEDLIVNYVSKYKPLDKAGSYGIQELPDGFVKSIEGSFENIIGLCPLVVKNLIEQ